MFAEIHLDYQTSSPLFNQMIMFAKAQKYIKMIGFLAILCAVVLFPPASAHAGMGHDDATSLQTEHVSGNHGSLIIRMVIQIILRM